jgi:hypothetical protein
LESRPSVRSALSAERQWKRPEKTHHFVKVAPINISWHYWQDSLKIKLLSKN